jgi:hypothetical protein
MGSPEDAGADLLVLNLDFEQTDAVIGVRAAVLREQVPFVDVVADYLKRRAADESARGTPPRIGADSDPAVGRVAAGRTHAGAVPRARASGGIVRTRRRRVGAGRTKFGAELHDDGTAGTKPRRRRVEWPPRGADPTASSTIGSLA